MAGDHKCPVCGSTFTRSQHVARHMRSHTGDRPYKCVHCGDQFARSDLLSRHVNKCHTNEKKPGGASRARKPRQPSNSGTSRPSLDLHLAGHPTQPAFQPQRQPEFTHSSSDPFHPAPSPYAQHDPFAAHPGLPGSLPSSASASVDSLPAGLPYALPAIAPNFGSRGQQNPYLTGYRPTTAAAAHFEPTVAKHDDSSLFANTPASHPHHHHQQQQQATSGFIDLHTPLAYPYKSRTGSNASSDGHAGASNSYGAGNLYSHQAHGYGSEGHAPGLTASGTIPYIPPPNPDTHNPADGSFSSSFGLMSLEDPAVLAGVSEAVPFFDNNMTPQQQPDLHALLPPTNTTNTGSFDALSWNAFNAPGDPSSSGGAANVTPGTREREANQLRELWSAFLRDPTARLNPDGTEVARPDFPTPSLHRRSSSYSGSSAKPDALRQNSGTYPGAGKTPQQPQHIPSGSQPPHQGTSSVVAHLEAQAAREQQQRMQQQHQYSQQQQPKAQPVAHVASHANLEALKSYEEAILARKAPVLKMPPKLKMRDTAGSTSAVGGGSSVLPSISQTNRSIPGNAGGVGSLAAGSQMPSLAAASSVPPGSTPNQGLAALQQPRGGGGYDRQVLPMPKPRSRPSTATGYHPPDQSPTNAIQSMPTTPVHINSAPSSRPGTSTGQYPPAAQGDSHPGTSGGLESRPSTANSTSNSTPSTNPSNPNPSPRLFSPTWPPSAGYAAHPGQMLPPQLIPSQQQQQEKQLAEYNAAMSAALNINNTSPGATAAAPRPSYKRLASQILESANTKRPHRGLDDSAVEDEDEDEDGMGSQHQRHHTGRESSAESLELGSSAGVSSMGSHSQSGSFGQDGAGASFAGFRRMSESSANGTGGAAPASGGARMYPRGGNLIVAHANQHSPPGGGVPSVREVPITITHA